MSARQRFILAITALCLGGCAFLPAPSIPIPVDVRTICLSACDGLTDPAAQSFCRLGCPTATPTSFAGCPDPNQNYCVGQKNADGSNAGVSCICLPPRATPTATVIPTAGVTPSPTAPALEAAVPIGGICQETHAGATPHAFFAAQVEAAERAWIDANPDKWHRVAAQWNVAREFWNQNDTDIVRAIRAAGLDAAIEADGNGGSNGSIAVAAHGDAGFHEGYSIRVSSGDVRFPFNGNSPNGFMGRCEPRGFAVGSATSTATPAPTATPTRIAQATCAPLLTVTAAVKGGSGRLPWDEPGKYCYLIDMTGRFDVDGSGRGQPCNAEHFLNCGDAGNVFPFAGEACEPDPESLQVTYASAQGPAGTFTGYSGRVCGPIGSAYSVKVTLTRPASDKAGRPISQSNFAPFLLQGAI